VDCGRAEYVGRHAASLAARRFQVSYAGNPFAQQ
jgi:hypothetical protein